MSDGEVWMWTWSWILEVWFQIATGYYLGPRGFQARITAREWVEQPILWDSCTSRCAVDESSCDHLAKSSAPVRCDHGRERWTIKGFQHFYSNTHFPYTHKQGCDFWGTGCMDLAFVFEKKVEAGSSVQKAATHVINQSTSSFSMDKYAECYSVIGRAWSCVTLWALKIWWVHQWQLFFGCCVSCISNLRRPWVHHKKFTNKIIGRRNIPDATKYLTNLDGFGTILKLVHKMVNLFS